MKTVHQPIIKIPVGRKTKFGYDDIVFDSKEEIYIYWLLMEIKNRRIIKEIEVHPRSFNLVPGCSYKYYVKLKTKVSEKEGSLFKGGHGYTPDFRIVWDTEAPEFSQYVYWLGQEFGSMNAKTAAPFIAQSDNYKRISWLDVKGGYAIYNNHREFIINQKLMMQVYGIYVQKVEPDKLFKKVGWYPRRYLWTDGGKIKRKLEKKKPNRLCEFEHFIKVINSLF